MKKQARKTIKKTVTSRQLSTKKRSTSKIKKPAVSKKSISSKPIGVFVSFAGMIGLASLMLFAIGGFWPSAVVANDSSVLGATTGMMAPADFKAMVVNYSVMLSWSNTADGDYQYVIWVYDSAEKKYHPEKIIDGNGSVGEVITKTYDQEPGTTLLYKVSMCEDCRLKSDRTITGNPGDMSPGLVVKVPMMPTPSSLRIANNIDGIKLTWSQSLGVDGFNIWRKTSYFGRYSKIGSVGTNGTYSAYHTYDADGVARVPIDVPSPTIFIDNDVIPGRRYYYKITSKKMIVPLVGKSGWLSTTSRDSRQVAIVAAKLSTPKGFTAKAAAKDRVIVSVMMGETSPKSGYYLYCDKCSTKRLKLLSSENSDIQFGGIDSDKKLMSFSLRGLSDDTRYGLRLSSYRIVGRRVYESPKTKTIYLTTTEVQSPLAPADFKYNESADPTEASFTWGTIEDESYDYSMAIDCVKNSNTSSSLWKGRAVPYKINTDSIYAAEIYGFSIKDLDKKKGSCTAYLTAYDPKTALYSEPAVATFEDKVD